MEARNPGIDVNAITAAYELAGMVTGSLSMNQAVEHDRENTGIAPRCAVGQAEADLIGALSRSLPGYEISSEICRGGQGVVFRSTQPTTRRELAICMRFDVTRSGSPTLARGERSAAERQVESAIGMSPRPRAADVTNMLIMVIKGRPQSVVEAMPTCCDKHGESTSRRSIIVQGACSERLAKTERLGG